MIKFEDRAAPIGMRLTADGYLVGEVRCARTGVQQYLASEVGLAGDGMVNVYRPEETVFDKASLATFAGKPVTLLHPSVPVTADNWREYAVGDVGEDIARDGEFVRVPIKLMDAGVIKAVQDGTREISMGYTCGVEVKDGVAPDGTPYQAVQTGPLRINHLAIVPKARGGPELRVGDGADKWGAAPVSTVPTRDHQGERPMTVNLQKVVVDGLTIETTDQGAQVISKLQGALDDAQKALTDAETLHQTDMAKVEAERDDYKAKYEDALKKIPDTAAMDAAVAARSDLIAKARAIVPEIKTDGLSDADIRKAVVVAKFGDAMKDKPEAYIDARFDMLAEDAASAGALAHAIAARPQAVGDAAAYAKVLADHNAGLNAHRKQ